MFKARRIRRAELRSLIAEREIAISELEVAAALYKTANAEYIAALAEHEAATLDLAKARAALQVQEPPRDRPSLRLVHALAEDPDVVVAGSESARARSEPDSGPG